MSYNTTYRIVMCSMAAFLLALAGALYFVPGILEGKSPFWDLVIKIGWVGITAVAILAPLQAFREFAVVSDDGLLKSSLWGSLTRLSWKEMTGLRAKPGENELTFESASGTKLKMSLCYDGWEDFCDVARKYLPPHLLYAIAQALADERRTKKRG